MGGAIITTHAGLLQNVLHSCIWWLDLWLVVILLESDAYAPDQLSQYALK